LNDSDFATLKNFMRDEEQQRAQIGGVAQRRNPSESEILQAELNHSAIDVNAGATSEPERLFGSDERPSGNERQKQREREEGEDMHESSPDSKLPGHRGERPELRKTTLPQTDESTTTTTLPTTTATANSKPVKNRDAFCMSGRPGAHSVVSGVVTEKHRKESPLSSGDSVLPGVHCAPGVLNTEEDREESSPLSSGDSVLPDERRVEGSSMNLISATLVDESQSETEIMDLHRQVQQLKAVVDQLVQQRRQNAPPETRMKKNWFPSLRGKKLLRRTTTDAVQ